MTFVFAHMVRFGYHLRPQAFDSLKLPFHVIRFEINNNSFGILIFSVHFAVQTDHQDTSVGFKAGKPFFLPFRLAGEDPTIKLNQLLGCLGKQEQGIQI